MTVPQEPVYVVGPRGPKGDPGDGAGLTQEQVEAIVTAAIAALPPSGLTQAQVVTIVNSALSGLPPAGLTAGQVTTLLSATLETALAPYETTAAMSTAITTALTEALEHRTQRLGIVATMPRLPGYPGPVRYGEGPGVQTPVAVVHIGSKAYLVGGTASPSFGSHGTLVPSNGFVPYITPYDLDTDTYGTPVHIPIPEGAPTRSHPLENFDTRRDTSGRGFYRVGSIQGTDSSELSSSPQLPQLAGHDVWITDYYNTPATDLDTYLFADPLIPYSGKDPDGKNIIVSSQAAGTGLHSQYLAVTVDLGTSSVDSISWEDWEEWLAALTPIQRAVVEAGYGNRRAPGNVTVWPNNEPTPVGDRVGWCLGWGSEAFEVDGKIMFGGGVTNLYQPPLTGSGVSLIDQPENHPWVLVDENYNDHNAFNRLLGKIHVEDGDELTFVVTGNPNAGANNRTQVTLFNVNPNLNFTMSWTPPPGAVYWELIYNQPDTVRHITAASLGGAGDYWVVVTTTGEGPHVGSPPLPSTTPDIQFPATDRYLTPEWSESKGRTWMLYDPADGSFTTCPPAPVGFPLGVAGGAEGKAYFIALRGTADLMVYDLATETWTTTDITDEWTELEAGVMPGTGVVVGRELLFPTVGVQINLDTGALSSGLNISIAPPPEGMALNYFFVNGYLAVPEGFRVFGAGFDLDWNYLPGLNQTYHLDTQTWTVDPPSASPAGDPIGGIYLDNPALTVFNSEGEARTFGTWAVLGMTDAPDPVLRRPGKDEAIPFGTDDTAINSVGLAYRNGRFRIAVDEDGWVTPGDEVTGVLAYMTDLAIWNDALTKWTEIGYGSGDGGGLLWLPMGNVGNLPSAHNPGQIVKIDDNEDSPFYGLARFMDARTFSRIKVVNATEDSGDFRDIELDGVTLIDPQGHNLTLSLWALGPSGNDGSVMVISNVGTTTSLPLYSPYQPLHGGPSDGLLHPGQSVWVLTKDYHYYCISKS